MEATREAPRTVASGRDGGAATAQRPSRPYVRIILIALAVILALVLLVFAVEWFAYASTHETTDDAELDADVVQVTSKISERVDKILVGTNQYVRRGALLVVLDDQDERDRVTAARASYEASLAQVRAANANVLLTRDTQRAQDLQSLGAIDQAKAGIASASAQASSQVQQTDAELAAVAASQAQARAAGDAEPGAYQNLRKSSADLRRTQSLVSTGDLSVAQLDAARAQYAAAASQYAQARANTRAANAQVDQAEQRLDAQRYEADATSEQIGVQQANLTTAQGKLAESSAPSRVSAQQAQAQAQSAQTGTLHAQLVTAQNNLGYTRISAPIDAYVGQKNVEIGQTVAPGESLMTLIPSSGTYITANYKETQVGHMRVGQEVDINIDAYSGKKFVGHVENLSPASQNTFSLVPAQNATGNFVKVTQRLPVRILVDRVEGGKLADYPLRPGMSVETSVKIK